MASQRNFRPPETKPFTLDGDKVPGASEQERYESVPGFKEINAMHAMCTLYAQSYSLVMMKRIKAENENFFEEAGIPENELIAHLTNNMCLPYTKLKSQAYRSATATLKDRQHIKDEIRKLYNDGDTFHPYF